VLSMNDESEIRRIHDEWIRLEESGKQEGILKFCGKGVVWLVPGLGELQGIEEIRSYLVGQPETVIVSIDTFNVEVEVSNELAVKRARFCTTFMDGDAEAKVTGTHIWTLRKDRQEGQWQVTSVAWVIEAKSS
jgi:ketosteroid isomerase-like protein